MNYDVFMANYDNEKAIIAAYFRKSNSLETATQKITDLEALGQGGTSIVYKGNFKGHKVVVKVLAVNLTTAANEQRIKRFKDEISALMLLTQQKHIIPILNASTLKIDDKEYLYYLMPLHQTLKDFMKGKTKNADEISRLTSQLIAGIHTLHRKGIIHRDLKPENILVNSEGTIVIADIGIAWFDEEFMEKLAKTKKGERIGNYEFSPPEQAQGLPAKVTMDLYALGQLIQWMVTDSNHRGTQRKKLEEVLPELKHLDGVVDKLISHDPENRYQSIEETLEAIQASLKTKKQRDRYAETSDRLFNSVISFDKLLRARVSIQTNRFVECTSSFAISKFFKQLNSEVDGVKPWLTYGNGTMDIKTIERIGWRKWLLSIYELIIDKIVVYYSHAPYYSFIAIVCLGDTQLGLSSESQEDGEYGFIPILGKLGKYVSREDYDNGYFNLLGFRLKLPNNTKLRVRWYKKRVILLGAVGSSILDMDNDQVVSQCIDKFMTSNNCDDLAPLTYLPKHRAIHSI